MGLKSKSEFGELLIKLIKEKKMSQSEFYCKLNIKKPYFYDIISGKVNPPPPEIQIKIIKILQPQEKSMNELLDIAAKYRNEIQADIMFYLKNKNNAIKIIREGKEYKKIWGGIIDE